MTLNSYHKFPRRLSLITLFHNTPPRPITQRLNSFRCVAPWPIYHFIFGMEKYQCNAFLVIPRSTNDANYRSHGLQWDGRIDSCRGVVVVLLVSLSLCSEWHFMKKRAQRLRCVCGALPRRRVAADASSSAHEPKRLLTLRRFSHNGLRTSRERRLCPGSHHRQLVSIHLIYFTIKKEFRNKLISQSFCK